MSNKDKPSKRFGSLMATVTAQSPAPVPRPLPPRHVEAAGVTALRRSPVSERADLDRPASRHGGRIMEFDPARVCMWSLHNRVQKYLTPDRIEGLARQLKEVGQEQPALGRRLPGGGKYDVELIYGARRLSAARVANVPLLVEIVDISDQDALRAMEAENAEREDLSDYEHGLHYARLLRESRFKGVKEMGETLGIERTRLTRLLELATIPGELIDAIGSPYDMPTSLLLKVAALLTQNPGRLDGALATARDLKAQGSKPKQILHSVIQRLKTERPATSSARPVVYKRNRKPFCEVSGTPGKGVVRIMLLPGDAQTDLYTRLVKIIEGAQK